MASSKGATTDLDVLKIVFLNNYDPAWRTNANLYISLHNADPTAAGTQTSSETTYANYARVAVLKTAVGWTVAGTSAQNAGQIQFNQCNGAGDTVSHVGIGTVVGPGAGQLLYLGKLNADLVVANLIQPQFAALALTVTES